LIRNLLDEYVVHQQALERAAGSRGVKSVNLPEKIKGDSVI
jgi:hypothetical protein